MPTITRLSLALATPILAMAGTALVAGGPESSATSPGKPLFDRDCAVCHAVSSDGKAGFAPNLFGLEGRKAGSGDFEYSPQLAGSQITWSPQTLDHFLADPNAAVPGTTMPVAITDAEERKAIVDHLLSLK